MDQIHLSPLVDQIQLALGHISNKHTGAVPEGEVPRVRRPGPRTRRRRLGVDLPDAEAEFVWTAAVRQHGSSLAGNRRRSLAEAWAQWYRGG
jgi:hypothetical protein